VSSRALTAALAALAWSAGIALANAMPARAGSARADSTRLLPTAHESIAPDALQLGRAALERGRGDLHGVIENLEGIDFSTEPSFAEADRAAFLLGAAYLELGDVSRFASLARGVSGWKRASVYTRWLAYELQLVGAGGDGGRALPLQAVRLEPFGAAGGGADDVAGLTALSNADTTTSLGRDLVGAALIRLATRVMAAGVDARAWLERVPLRSRYASRARHMLGLLMLERGEAGPGAVALESLLADDSTYGARREVMLALAGQALDQGRWEAAHQTYRAIDGDWGQERGTLERLLSAGSFDGLWSAWEAHPDLSGMVALDARPARLLAEELATASADLRSRPGMETPPLDEPRATTAPAWPVAPPPAAMWSATAASANRLAEANAEVERARWAVARERAALEERRRYLEVGRERIGGEEAQLLARKALLDSLRRTLDALDARLRATRDEEGRHAAARATAILKTCDRNLLWMRAMRHYSIEGPDSSRVMAHPDDLPGPDSLLAAEERLAQSVRAWAEGLAAAMPGLLARSYSEAWRPGLIDRVASQAVSAGEALAWSRSIGASIDSGLAASRGSGTLRRLEARVAALATRADSLGAADTALRARVAGEAIRRAMAALDDEREAIDYGLGVSAYGMSVRLDPRDSLDTRAAAPEPGPEPADAAAARWRGAAIPLLTGFLARHPRSPARAEMRFRLADLELTEASEAFRERMAAFTRKQAAGEAAGLAIPVLNHARALALYRQILDEDREFNHRDAVLFYAGMILADEGDPGAAGYFRALVTGHPQSPYCQEAYLRMGDMEFDEKRFAASVALYEHAGAGADPTLRTIAFYKMGWAHFSEDRFPAAADAFRSVLDLYASSERGAIRVDIEDEAEAYLVHSLAGAGGAPAFAEYFDRIGARPYEQRVLTALGQHFRRYGEYPDAAAADQLWLRRYPTHADALVIARRLVEPYTRSNRPALERDARLTLAPRFVPGGEWFAAQASDSVRAAGATFARSSWLSVALDHHRRARENASAAEWREAARLYEIVLDHWPHDPEAPALELGAGEAGVQLGDYATALQHYGAAARAGSDSIASIALWQRVAVTDAWYERTRPDRARAGAAPGSDSLAHAVIDTGDQLLARFPQHARSADIVWRQSQLALAHGWRERAVRDLARMTARYPDDARTPVAASQRGDALYRLEDFEAAGAAFEEALELARRAGRDSLARVAARAIPVCYFRHAESATASDSAAYERNAARFEQVATRWPQYEHAPLAQYRAGLAYVRAGRPRDAVRVMQALLQRFPGSAYVRDARLQIASSWEALGEREQAALAYVEFAEHHPDDESAGPAYLKAADLETAAGQAGKADELRLIYIRKFPGDVETAMTILEAMARRELDRLGPGHPISTLLGTARPRRPGALPSTRLADYMRRATAHPALASRDLIARVRFLQGEEAYTAYGAARLVQPLTTSIPVRKRLLDTLLVRYRRTVDLGVPDWAHAAAFRIGLALVEFGDALEHSERPADLHGDDLRAYESVLVDQSRAFSERGAAVWTDLLRQNARKGSGDAWTAQAQATLWQRLASRFLYRPEAEFPLVRAIPPARDRDEPRGAEGTKASLRTGSSGARALAQHGDPE